MERSETVPKRSRTFTATQKSHAGTHPPIVLIPPYTRHSTMSIALNVKACQAKLWQRHRRVSGRVSAPKPHAPQYVLVIDNAIAPLYSHTLGRGSMEFRSYAEAFTNADDHRGSQVPQRPPEHGEALGEAGPASSLSPRHTRRQALPPRGYGQVPQQLHVWKRP